MQSANWGTALLLCLSILTGATAGSDPAGAAQHHQPGHRHGHHAFPPEVAKLHDVLAPLWHAPEGDARALRTCGEATALGELAVAVQAAPVPAAAGDSTAWAAATRRLVERIDALARVCTLPDRAEFDETFVAVHEAFHGLVQQVGHHH